MRVLCISDIHSNFNAFDPNAMPTAGLCLVAGDVTEYGKSRLEQGRRDLREARNWLAALGERQPTFVIPGNHDIGVRNSDFSGIGGVTPLLDRQARAHGFTLYGVSLCPTYNMPRMAKMYDLMTVDPDEEAAAYDFAPVDIVLSHCPPLGYLDRLREPGSSIYGPHVGSEALLRAIAVQKPKLVVCGHVHNDTGQAWIGETLVINVAKQWGVVEI